MGLGGNDFGGALSDMVLGGLAQSVALYAAGAAVASKAGRVLYLDDDTDKRAIAVAMGAEAEPLALNADLSARCAALHGVRAFSPGTCHAQGTTNHRGGRGDAGAGAKAGLCGGLNGAALGRGRALHCFAALAMTKCGRGRHIMQLPITAFLAAACALMVLSGWVLLLLLLVQRNP